MDFPGLISVSTLVKDQKPSVNAVCDEPLDAGQRDINGMRVATNIVGCFKNSVIWALPCSAWTAASPEMPKPTMAIRCWLWSCVLVVISARKIKMLRSAPMRTREGGGEPLRDCVKSQTAETTSQQ